MSTYNQYCPIAKAMELLDERWTLLVVRELLLGSRHFNELRRGVPRMSPALLSKRLKHLERANIVRRTEAGGRSAYDLTPQGEELRQIVESLGVWGVRWATQLGDEDLDPHLLMWDLRRTIPAHSWPAGRTVIAFVFSDVASRASRWWLCVEGGAVDLCDYDPGFDIDATVTASLRALTQVWRGDQSWTTALKSGSVLMEGPALLTRRLPDLIGSSSLAAVPRPA